MQALITRSADQRGRRARADARRPQVNGRCELAGERCPLDEPRRSAGRKEHADHLLGHRLHPRPRRGPEFRRVRRHSAAEDTASPTKQVKNRSLKAADLKKWPGGLGPRGRHDAVRWRPGLHLPQAPTCHRRDARLPGCHFVGDPAGGRPVPVALPPIPARWVRFEVLVAYAGAGQSRGLDPGQEPDGRVAATDPVVQVASEGSGTDSTVPSSQDPDAGLVEQRSPIPWSR